MMNTGRVILAGLLIAPLATFAGCGGSGSAAPMAGSTGGAPTEVDVPDRPLRAGLFPQTRPPIADLPVPVGFKMVEATSRHDVTGGIRTVDHTYKGRDDKTQVERFYHHQMPMLGWTVQDSDMVAGTHTLWFAKGSERCAVRISEQRRPIRKAVTVIEIDISRPDAADVQGDGTASNN